MKTKGTAGFTLIEVIIYIALFSVLLGTAFITAYELLESSDTLSAKNTTGEEGNFVMRKLNWALSGVSEISVPSTGTLTVIKYDGNIINFRLNSDKIEMKESASGNIFIPITTSNVSVTSLQFSYIPASGGAPAGLTVRAAINGVTFTITKYLRT
jgi:prepilin-type N-terminal cleavage/methylation domain-containing protein